MEVIGNVISGAKELYDSTNKANLSGAIDVVVVKQVSTVLWFAAQHSPKSIHLRLLRLSTNSLAQICWPLVRSSLFFSFRFGACDSIGVMRWACNYLFLDASASATIIINYYRYYYVY